MRRFHAAWLLILATGALSATAATSAMAAAEWLLNGSSIASATAAKTTGELLLEDMGTKTDVLCSATLEGTVGPGATDEITKIVDLESKNPLNCTIQEKGACEEANGSLILVTPVNLP